MWVLNMNIQLLRNEQFERVKELSGTLSSGLAHKHTDIFSAKRDKQYSKSLSGTL